MPSKGIGAIRSEVRALHPYYVRTPAHRSKANQNEFPLDVPEAIKEAVVSRLLSKNWSRYPEIDMARLRKSLRRSLGISESLDVLVGNGSNNLIQCVFSAVLGAGTPIVLPVPTFSLYEKLIILAGGRTVPVALNDDFTYDVARILDVRTQCEAPVILLARPNNPTGRVIPLADLERIVEATPGLVVVDEAYVEFAKDSTLPLLEAHENLLLLRTFSKAWRAAGLRMGYLIGWCEVVRELAKTVLPFNTSLLVETAGLTILEHTDALRPAIEGVRRERDRMLHAMEALRGIEPFPSEANFLLFRAMGTSQRLFDALLDEGILVRDVSAPGALKDCLRVSVGTFEQNEAFLEILKDVMHA